MYKIWCILKLQLYLNSFTYTQLYFAIFFHSKVKFLVIFAVTQEVCLSFVVLNDVKYWKHNGSNNSMQKTRALQIYVKILNKFEIIPIDRSVGHKPS